MSHTVAIMQPYFIPYAGYFRLFAASDLFVVYDCVQFPRRGWVHRNRLEDRAGMVRWLTLPLAKAPQDVRIRDLQFAPGAAALFAQRLRPFSFACDSRPDLQQVLAALHDLRGSPVDYVERLLGEVVRHLGLRWNVVRSSTLNVPAEMRGQDRILEIARRVGARCYVNAPGGRALYDPERFADAGIGLRFLPDYGGPEASILGRLLQEDRQELARNIRATLGQSADI